MMVQRQNPDGHDESPGKRLEALAGVSAYNSFSVLGLVAACGDTSRQD
jgi:hypothetical protein